MVDSDSSVTSLGGHSPATEALQDGSTRKSTSKKQSDDNDDDSWKSVDLLLTQDEWSGDEEEEEEDDMSMSASSPPVAASPSVSNNNDTLKTGGTKANKNNNEGSHESKIPGTLSTSPSVKNAKTSSSPATRTLDSLSQSSSQDLRYDMSQLEVDAAAASAMLSLRSGDTQSQEVTPESFSKASSDRASKSEAGKKTESVKQQQKLGSTTANKPSQTSRKTTATKEAEKAKAPKATVAKNKGSKDKPKITTNKSKPKPQQPKNRSKPQPAVANTAPINNGHPTTNQQDQQPQQAPPSVQQQQQHQQLQEEMSQRVDLTNYDILPFEVAEEGSLGMTIAKSHPPADLLPTATQQYCRIKEVFENKLGHSLGLQAGDWFLIITDKSAQQRLADYETIVAIVRYKKRPITLYVARRKKNLSQQNHERDSGKTTSDEVSIPLMKDQENDRREEPEPQTRAPPATSKADSATTKVTVERSKNGNTKTVNTKKPPSGAVKDSSKQVRHQKQSGGKEDDDDSDGSSDEESSLVLPNNDSVVPYCILCNNPKAKAKKRAVHHALCPKNDCFENSGASKLLQNIINGIQMGCPQCSNAYEVGRVNTKEGASHITSCPCRKDEQQDCNQTNNKRSTAETTTANDKKISTSKKGASVASKSRDEGGNASKKRGSEIEEPTPPQTKKQKRDNSDRFSLSAKSNGARQEDAAPKTSNESSKSKATKSQSTSVARTKSSVTTPGNEAAQSKRVGPKPVNSTKKVGAHLPKRPLQALEDNVLAADSVQHPSKKMRASLKPMNDDVGNLSQNSAASDMELMAVTTKPPSFVELSSQPPKDDGDRVKSKWIGCENPWGPVGYLEGDVTLMTSRSGLGHYETLLPSLRFESQPFSASVGYHKTHFTPEEGFHLLRLERDPEANRPWGFTVQRHEFGGACLVENVDPMSPAEAAMFVGGSSDSDRASSRLQVNDMIVAINGHDVGGMTEVGVQIELEVAGPSLSLVVSRHRHSGELYDRVAEAEKIIDKAINEEINDDRNLGWVDVGASSAATAATTTAAVVIATALNRQLLSNQHTSESSNPNNTVATGKKKSSRVSFDLPPPNRLDTEDDRSNNEAKKSLRATNDPETAAPFEDQMQSTEDSLSPEVRERVNECGMREQTKAPPTSLRGPESNAGAAASVMPQEQSEAPSGFLASNSELDEDAPLPPRESPVLQRANYLSSKDQKEMGLNIGKGSYDAKDDDTEQGDGSEEDDDDDGNPALGCVCGEIHCRRYKVFWIQCDECNAWYNVARKCVGFSEAEAEERGKWTCWACSLSDGSDDDDDQSKCELSVDEGYTSASPEMIRSKHNHSSSRRRREPESPGEQASQGVLPIGTMVLVDKEGSHLYGGIGRVIGTYLSDDGEERLYSVKYVIESYTEHDISAEALTLQNGF